MATEVYYSFGFQYSVRVDGCSSSVPPEEEKFRVCGRSRKLTRVCYIVLECNNYVQFLRDLCSLQRRLFEELTVVTEDNGLTHRLWLDPPVVEELTDAIDKNIAHMLFEDNLSCCREDVLFAFKLEIAMHPSPPASTSLDGRPGSRILQETPAMVPFLDLPAAEEVTNHPEMMRINGDSYVDNVRGCMTCFERACERCGAPDCIATSISID